MTHALVVLDPGDLQLYFSDPGGMRSYHVGRSTAGLLYDANYDVGGGEVVLGGQTHKLVCVAYRLDKDERPVSADITISPRLPAQDDWQVGPPQACDYNDDCEACQ